jgi:kynurenine formamidase
MKTYLKAILFAFALSAFAAEPEKVQHLKVPSPPWPAGDERGMANQIGPATLQRCGWHMSQPGAKTYELSQIRSNTMPLSPFSGPYAVKPNPTAGIPGTAHAYNTETLNQGADPGQQGTQFDALGHFGFRAQPWDGKSPFDQETITYYGGFTQKEVKPTPDSPLLKLGIEKAPAIITSAVLLYIYTGWSDYWQDPDTDKVYYSKAPGLSYDAAKYLTEKRIVAIGLDTPFIDPVPEGMLAGKAGPAEGTPPNLPFAIHHQMITQAGIHHIENAKLDELARDRVWTSCTMVLPPREKGAAGGVIRPVAIGVPAVFSRK